MKKGRLNGFVVAERTDLFDFELRACFVALGAAAENIVVAATELGLHAHVEVCPDPNEPMLAWRMRFARSTSPADPLFSQIPRRVTNRKTGVRSTLVGQERTALSEAATSRGAHLALVESSTELKAIAELMGRCDRFLLMTPAGHRVTFSELRFSSDDVLRTRDGLDVDSLELSAAGRAALEVLSDWRVMSRVREIGGGRVLEDFARRAVSGACAVGLVRVEGDAPSAIVHGGRAIQRLWLTATRLGLSLHPWTRLPYLMARVDAGQRDGLSDDEWGWFASLTDGYRALFPSRQHVIDILLFRLGRADPPTARSLRLPIDDVLQICGDEPDSY